MRSDKTWVLDEILKLEDEEELILFRGTKTAVESHRMALERTRRNLPPQLGGSILIRREVVDKDKGIYDLIGKHSDKGRFQLVKITKKGEKVKLPSYLETLEKERINDLRKEDGE